METYLREAGIIKVTTPPYTPAQNGIAERANRTLTEAARCMLLDAGLGNEYWGYAILAAVHIINHMPSRVPGGNFSRKGAAHFGQRERIKLVKGVLRVAEHAVVRVVPSDVVWPPAPCHPKL